jgi:hypothetical protein
MSLESDIEANIKLIKRTIKKLVGIKHLKLTEDIKYIIEQHHNTKIIICVEPYCHSYDKYKYIEFEIGQDGTIINFKHNLVQHGGTYTKIRIYFIDKSVKSISKGLLKQPSVPQPS